MRAYLRRLLAVAAAKAEQNPVETLVDTLMLVLVASLVSVIAVGALAIIVSLLAHASGVCS